MVAAILAVPWTLLGGLLWWFPHRMQGSSPCTRYAVYAMPVVLTIAAVYGAFA